MKKLIMTVVLTSVALTYNVAQARDYGPGCGLGKALVDGQSGLGPHIGAWVLNHIILPQSFSQTSGILGCDNTTTVKNEHAEKEFVAQNMDSISADMAMGKGEHLAALAALLGIDEKDQTRFFEVSQQNYSSIFDTSDADAEKLLSKLSTAMAADSQLSAYIQ